MRDRYLAAMGIEVWKLRDRDEHADPELGHDAATQLARIDDARHAAARDVAAPSASAASASARSATARDAAAGRAAPSADPPRAAAAPTSGRPDDHEPSDWDRLAATVSACTLCELHRTRTQTVFGVGRRDAELLVVGEAPGADEDRAGEPFVGRAGRLLNAMLKALGYPREQVYIANILKCRPPNNRDPRPEEAAHCSSYLEQQIALIKPRAVLGVGRIAAQHLLQTDEPIGRLRGRVLSFGADRTPIVVTYHPAYLLRSPAAKAKAWQDLCAVRRLIRA